jgi:hypothetical protein
MKRRPRRRRRRASATTLASREIRSQPTPAALALVDMRSAANNGRTAPIAGAEFSAAARAGSKSSRKAPETMRTMVQNLHQG